MGNLKVEGHILEGHYVSYHYHHHYIFTKVPTAHVIEGEVYG